MAQGKNTVKSFVRENKFHTYLTRESLSAEERVSKFHNHGKTPSYQTFADASVRKFVPKSHGEVPWRNGRKGPLRFETGTECYDHPRGIVSRSQENCSNNKADGAIYGRKLDLY